MERIYGVTNNGYNMNYVVFYPKNYSKNLPLITYLHGAGERGENVEHVFRHGLARVLNEGKELNAVILIPQCPKTFVWDNVVEGVKSLIDKIISDFDVDKKRVSLTGSSMGGFGTWMMGLTYPEFFSAIAPVAGGGMSWRTAKLVNVPIKSFHGTIDLTVPIIYSKMMVDGVNECGGNAELVPLEGFSHNDGINYAYDSTDLIQFLLTTERKNWEKVKEVCEELF